MKACEWKERSPVRSWLLSLQASLSQSSLSQVVNQTRITGRETRHNYHLKRVLRCIRKQEKDNLPDEGGKNEMNECRERERESES